MIDVPRAVLAPFLLLLGSGEQSASLSCCPLEMPSPSILRSRMVAMKEMILRYWQLFLKALSLQHLEKYFPRAIFLSRAQPKLVHLASSALGSPSSLVRPVLNKASGTISLCFSLWTWILQEEELVGISFRMGKL